MQTDLATWDDLRVLLALHRHRSFLAAGRALGVSTSTVARRIEALEGALGRGLVQRSSSGTAVEPEALELVSLAERLEHGLKVVGRDEEAERSGVSGTVRISAGEGFVRPLTGVLADLRRRHPGLHFEVISEARLSDLSRREADVGIRKVRSTSPVLVEKFVGRIRFGLYAARSYVERWLPSARLYAGDFERHAFVGYEGPLRKLPQEQWLVAQGAKRFTFRSNADHALLAATENGHGICVIAEAYGEAIPGLVRIRAETEVPSAPVYLVFHRDLRRVPRIRVVVAELERALRKGLA